MPEPMPEFQGMPMGWQRVSSRERGLLRIQGEGDAAVSDLRKYFVAVEQAYNALTIFDSIPVFRVVSFEHIRYGLPRLDWGLSFPELTRLLIQQRDLSNLILPRDRLRLFAVQLSSPGFWQFLGKLNPLEVIRQFLQDRHERRKDREYREDADRHRLDLENAILENKVIKERIAIARKLGATDENLAPLLNRFIVPLRRIGEVQDSGLIGGAEITELSQGDPSRESRA